MADKGVVRVPLYADGRRSRAAQTRALMRSPRDESYALMLDRMKNPKNYDALTGRRLVNDGVVDDLSDDEIFQLAKRLRVRCALPCRKIGTAVPTKPTKTTAERQDRRAIIGAPTTLNRFAIGRGHQVARRKLRPDG